jgi:hypothetical protein
VKFKGTLIGPASGKLNGLVASHNGGGQYFRKLTIPTNPNTPQQAAVRNLMASLTNLWNNTLTATQRAAWNTYAANVTVLDRLGDAIKISGIAQYVRSNMPRVQAGLARVDTGPTVFNTGSFTTPTISSLTASSSILLLAFTNTDDWAAEVGSSMLVYTSRPQNPGISFFKGPYRFAGRINGAASPPTSPGSITAAFPFAVGNRVFIRVQVSRADGRLSDDFRNFGTGV